jgi:holo-[acyl-carrier protein] synthase
MQHVGVDIVEISRIEEAIANRGDAFLKRIYTAAELASYRHKIPSLAARFSAKEAVIKALSCKALKMTDIEVLSAPDGKPVLTLHGKARERAACLGLTALDISLSHSREYAVACAVGLSP